MPPGKYESIITKELFDRAQQVLKEHQTTATMKRDKEFAFTRMMTCGQCGSGITADEKFKYQQNGNVHRFVYYVCTRTKNQNCRGVSMNEKEIIKQLSEMIDKVSLDRLGIKQKLESEIDRYSQFRYAVLGLEEKELEKKKNVDMKKYAKYILERGSLLEKREIIASFRDKIQIKDKKLLINII